MIDNHTWDMILGKSGKLPGELAPEIIELAKSKGLEFTDEDPQKNYPDELDNYRKEMDENGWDYGEDDEELFELAMHDRQYRDYKSGVAKKRFLDDLQRAKDAAMAKSGLLRPKKDRYCGKYRWKVRRQLLLSVVNTSMTKCSVIFPLHGENTKR